MSAEEAAAKEIELITFYDSYYHGLNNTLGGEGRLKYSTIEEKKMAIAAAQKKYHDKIKGSDQSKRYLDYNNRLHKNKYYNPATRDHELEIQAKARNKRRSTAEGKQYEQDKNKKSKEAVKQLRQFDLKGYNFRSGFMTKGTGFYYFSYEDLRSTRPTLMIRTADPTIKNKKGDYADYRGGPNMYPDLELHGIEINEPRAKCDFNSN